MSDESADDQWWYNTRSGVVEHGRRSPGVDRAGPFASEAEAAKAPERIRENSRRWASEDDD